MNNLGDNNFKLNLTTAHKDKRYEERDVKTLFKIFFTTNSFTVSNLFCKFNPFKAIFYDMTISIA